VLVHECAGGVVEYITRRAAEARAAVHHEVAWAEVGYLPWLYQLSKQMI
jgi:hypothetical protein